MLPGGKGFVVLGAVGIPSEQVMWVVCGFPTPAPAAAYAKICTEAVERTRAHVNHMGDFHESYRPEIQKLLVELKKIDPGVVSEEKFLPISWRSTPEYTVEELPWGMNVSE